MTRRRLANVYRLATKELFSLRRDPVLVLFIAYAFSYAVYIPATTTGLELRNASVAFVDEDRSQLSARLHDAITPPSFKRPAQIELSEVDRAMDAGRFTFVVDVPPRFEADVLAGRRPHLQLLVDATAMSQAGTGSAYLRQILALEIEEFAARARGAASERPVATIVRVAFNPNLHQSWHLGVVQLINNITVLAVLLTGAALLREREHGTLEHLLVMPLGPLEIALAKFCANGLVILVAALICLAVVVHAALGAPIRGSIWLFTSGTIAYLFATSAIGVFLSTLVRSMPQLGLLLVPVIFPMITLSGGITPLDGTPLPLRGLMWLTPSPHFQSFATAVLYRGAGLDVAWKSFAAIALIGAAFFAAALWRFRASLAVTRS
ncbi:MAG TPA: ABC transporter permease [Myxococcota bacterium]|nr:ABC transporter permease [Myxococcota bacterium]